MANLTAEQREAIWTALDKLARQHRAFQEADWALPESELAAIDEISAKFQPVDLVAKYRFLFDEQMPDVGTNRRDFTKYQETLDVRRSEAIREIVKAEGAGGIERLLDTAKEAHVIGRTLANARTEISADLLLKELDSADQHRAAYAFGYAWERSNKDGLPWLDATLPQLSGRPLAQARLLRVSTSFPEVWERLRKLGTEVEAVYWKEFVAMGLGQDFPFLDQVAQKLLEHGRPAAAVDLLAIYSDRADSGAKPELIADALDKLIQSPSDEQRRVSPYEIRQLLDVLQRVSFDEDRLAMLEWRTLPGLGYGTPVPALEKRLARDPQFFVEVLSLSFKRSDGTSEQQPAPEAAQNAFHLLQEWRIVPGSAERGGDVDDAKLREWLDTALRLLGNSDRVGVGSILIGQVFAHVKGDADGTWPTKPVRDAIERLASDEVERGFRSQIYNNRGITSRSLTAGGNQERQLADRFEKWESIIRDRWPRTAAVLRSIAQCYRAQGQAEDEEAERFKRGLDAF